MRQSKQTGFTLIELLTVVGIMAILTALLFPVFHKAKRQSHTSVCISNLRQFGVAVALYASDYDDHLAYAPDTVNKALVDRGDTVFGPPLDDLIRNLPDIRAPLLPYGAIKPLFRCPLDQMLLRELDQKPTWWDEYGSSYGYNDEKALTGRTLSGFPEPSRNLLFWDYEPFHTGSPGVSSRLGVLFADLHTKSVLWSDKTDALAADP